MAYDFALDKKAVISLIAGSVVIGVLLFLAGWIVGRQWPFAESPAVAATTTDNERAALPNEPVLKEAGPAVKTPKSATPKVDPPLQAPTTPTAAPQAAHAAATQVTDGAVAIISEAEAAPSTEAAASEPEYVTVQVGVFLDEKDASNLLHQIERKGYAPTFFTGRDAEARQWYAVRIGMYSDKQQAANAAANFMKQEKIKAVVRPAESL